MKQKHTVRNVLIAIAILLISFSAYTGHKVKEYNNFYDTIGYGTEIRNQTINNVNECKNLLLDVWHNSIWEESDERTDKYTKPNGYFVDDFNDALDNLYSDEEFILKLDLIEENQRILRKVLIDLENYPKGEERLAEAYYRLFENHVNLSMAILHPNGSYNDVSEEISDLINEDNELLMQIEALEG